MLKIGLAIEAINCYAWGVGLSVAVAGQLASFTVSTREVVRALNGSSGANATEPSGSCSWAGPATYGTGLSASFRVQLITDSASNSLSLLPAFVEELGNGSYSVVYTAYTGSSYGLFVLFDGVQIPGSPFTVSLHPTTVVGAASCSASGWGTQLVEKGGHTQLQLQVADNYGNNFHDMTFLASWVQATPGLSLQGSGPTLGTSWPLVAPAGSAPNATATATGGVFTISATVGPDLLSQQPLALSATLQPNGSFALAYDVPSQYTLYILRVLVNGINVQGSPFMVTALQPLKLPSSLIAVLWFLAALILALCMACSVAVYVWRKESVMRSSSPRFLLLLILGSMLSTLSVVFLAVEGSDQACQAAHTLLTVGLILSMASLLAKSSRGQFCEGARLHRVQPVDRFVRCSAHSHLLLVWLFVCLFGSDAHLQHSQASCADTHE